MPDSDPLLFGAQMWRRGLAAVGRPHVIEDNLLELLRDPVAFKRHGLLAIDVDRRNGYLSGPGKADPDVGHFRFAGTVHHASHHGDRHVLDTVIALAPTGHLSAQIGLDLVGQFLEKFALCPAASRTRAYERRERAESHGLQDLLCDGHLARAVAVGLRREGDANRVPY